MTVRKLTENQLLEEILRWQQGDASPLSINAESAEMLSRKNHVNRFYLNSGFDSVYFTRREMEVAVLLLEPGTYEEIANQLNLSERTIECYVKHMKLKLGCSSKKKLMERIQKIDLVKRYRDQQASPVSA